MDTTNYEPQTDVERYLEHFKLGEYKFRWTEATAYDRKLTRRANHLAARIATLWVNHDQVTTSHVELRRVTGMSKKTVERALPELAAAGWIRSSNGAAGELRLVLVIDERGLDLLLDERDRRKGYAGRRELNDQWTSHVMTYLAHTLGLDPNDLERQPKYKQLHAKIRSIVARMAFLDEEVRKLLRDLTEELPSEIRDPAGLFLSRAAQHIRRYPHLAADKEPRPLGPGATRLNNSVSDGSDEFP